MIRIDTEFKSLRLFLAERLVSIARTRSRWFLCASAWCVYIFNSNETHSQSGCVNFKMEYQHLHPFQYGFYVSNYRAKMVYLGSCPVLLLFDWFVGSRTAAHVNSVWNTNINSIQSEQMELSFNPIRTTKHRRHTRATINRFQIHSPIIHWFLLQMLSKGTKGTDLKSISYICK